MAARAFGIAAGALISIALLFAASLRRPLQTANGPLVESFALDVTINPASAEWVKQALKDAKHDKAEHRDLPARHARRPR